MSEKEISFKKLLRCCEILVGESVGALSRPYSHKIITQYLDTLHKQLVELETERKEALNSPIDATTPHTVPSAEALLEYRRKFNSLLYLSDTAKMTIPVDDLTRNLQLIQNPSLSHDEKNQEIEVRAQVRNNVQQSMKEILFEESNPVLEVQRKVTKKREFNSSLITEILEEQEKVRESTTDEMLLLAAGIRGIHERVHNNIKKDNDDIDTLGDALGKDIQTTATRTDTLTGLLNSGTTSMLMYWSLIFFVLTSFFGMYIFMKLFPK